MSYRLDGLLDPPRPNAPCTNAHVHVDVVIAKTLDLADLRPIFSSVCADFEAEPTEFDGEDDRVHLLVNYPPRVAVSSLVNSLKGVSGQMIRKNNYSGIRKKLWGGAVLKDQDSRATDLASLERFCIRVQKVTG